MNFGQALEALKIGHRVARIGWNGKGMWLALTPGSVVDTSNTPIRGALAVYVAQPAPVPVKVTIGAHIDMKASDGSLVIGWLASQTDMLSDDWVDLDHAPASAVDESGFMRFRRKQIAELRSYVDGEPLDGVSIAEVDRKAGSPKPGDMIARNPKNHEDQWLVAAVYFADNFEPLDGDA